MWTHLFTGGPTPLEYQDMLLCERFGWTIQELDATPAHRIQEFLLMWSVETEVLKDRGKPQKDANLQT